MKNFKLTLFSVLLTSVFAVSSCTSELDLKPEGVILVDSALKTPADMQKLLNSCYDALANQYNGTVQTYSDLMGDDIAKPFRDDLGFKTEIYNRSSNFFNSDVGGLYGRLYIPVYRVNTMELYYDKIIGLSEEEKTRMRAEGKFIRALCHFDLVRLWAQPYGYTADNSHLGVPIRDKATKDPLARATVAQVYDFVVSDLNYAIANLPAANGNYANKDAAKSLLAIVYFQMNKFNDALPLLNEIINSGAYTLSDSLNRFNSNASSQEYIFKFVSTSSNDNRASEFINRFRSDNNPQPDYNVSNDIYNLIAADTTDARIQFFGTMNPGSPKQYHVLKKFNEDYFPVPLINMTQLVLTRAEVLAELGQDLGQAVTDINAIIKRAYRGNKDKEIAANADARTILLTVRAERRKELFCEGDRVNYLKRIGALANPLDGAITIRNAVWNCPGLALQFPSSERTSIFVMNETGGCN
jgi:hypothetical protein